MPVIKYSIPISINSKYKDAQKKHIVDSEISDDRFANVEKDNTTDPLVSCLGLSSDSDISFSNGRVSVIDDSIYLTEDGRVDLLAGQKYLPEFKDAAYYFDLLEYGYIPKVYIYKRANDKSYIYKEFQYGSGDFTYTGIAYQPMEDRIPGEKDYIKISIQNPIEYSRIGNYRSEITEGDYLSASKNYENYMSQAGISLDNFLDKCQKISYTDSKVNEINISNFATSLQAKYYPVSQNVTVLVELNDGSFVQVSKEEIEVNQIDGVINLPKFNIGSGFDIKNFYLFYGIIPCIKILSDTSIDISKYVNPVGDLSVLDIDNEDSYANVRYSERHLALSVYEFTESSSTTLYVPRKYPSFFIEPDSNISINGSTVNAGSRLYIKNAGVNGITVSAPTNIIDIMEQVDYDQASEKYVLKNFLPTNIISVYGKFNYGGQEKLSHICFSRKVNPEKVINSYGYGTGIFSDGSYSSGGLTDKPTGKTTIVYSENSPEAVEPSLEDFSFIIDPAKDGYTFHTPACTLKENISVYELVGASVRNDFHNWDFSIPDIITLDSSKVRRGATYHVTIKPVINPLITTLYVHEGKFKSASLKGLGKYASTLSGLYSINSKFVNMRCGYKKGDGTIVYFKPILRADVMISKEAILSITSKFKNIRF